MALMNADERDTTMFEETIVTIARTIQEGHLARAAERAGRRGRGVTEISANWETGADMAQIVARALSVVATRPTQRRA